MIPVKSHNGVVYFLGLWGISLHAILRLGQGHLRLGQGHCANRDGKPNQTQPRTINPSQPNVAPQSHRSGSANRTQSTH